MSKTNVSFFINSIIVIHFSEPRGRDRKRTTSSSSSSTSTELCDDPASDCCSERSATEDDGDNHDEDDNLQGGYNDCDKNHSSMNDDGGNGVLQVVNSNHAETKAADEIDDVSLAEVLRANSEMLNRMCRGGDRGSPSTTVPVTPESTAAAAKKVDLEERLPGLIDDIGSLHATAAGQRDSFEDELAEFTVPTELPATLEMGQDDITEESVLPTKPFTPFPSKIRQPKRLGIELGLYPGGSN